MESLKKSDPKQIGPFETVARLGAGGMGVVYLAQRKSEQVAVKVISSSFMADSSARTRFDMETAALRKAKSPFVASVIDSSSADELPWLAVEFISGASLKELVDDKGPVTEGEWWSIAIAMSLALTAIHEAGLIHRDIKPANILMSDKGPKIIDFGISHSSDQTSVTETGVLAGSPGWLSPEQFDGLEITSASDVFSSGSLLAYLATGTNPWGKGPSTTSAAFMRAITSKPPILDGIQQEQKEIIDVLLQKEPRLRPDARELHGLLVSKAPREARDRIEAWVAANPQHGQKKVTRKPSPQADANFKVPSSNTTATESATTEPNASKVNVVGIDSVVPPSRRDGDLPSPPRRSRVVLLTTAGLLAAAFVVGGVVLLTSGAPETQTAVDSTTSASPQGSCPAYFNELSSVTNDVVQGFAPDAGEVSRVVETLRSISHPVARVDAAISDGADALAANRFGAETAQYLVVARQNLGTGVCPGF